MYNKILVPLDGSELAECVLPYVETMVTGNEGSSVTFLYVIQPVDVPLINQQFKKKIEAEAKDAAERYLEKLIAKLSYKESADCSVLVGKAAEGIADYATEKKIDLIIMSTHGMSGIGRWRHGSIADKVMHGVNIPVWMIRAEKHVRTFKKKNRKIKILVPLDGSPLAEAAVKHVSALAKQLDGDSVNILLFRVCELFAADEKHPGNMTPKDIEEYMENEKKRALDHCESYLDRIKNRLQKEGLHAEVETAQGNVAELIVGQANKIAADVLVMTTHGRTGIRRWAFGSTAEKVTQGADCPVFIIRSKEKKA
jgi:nucleotide-binding universal stress UspA family protein